MQIYVHRVNTIEKLKSVPERYGVEIDVRALGKRLVLNHEPHQDGVDLVEYLKQYHHSGVIFNIKEAGIEDEVVSLAEKFGVQNYFLLDVEYPYIYRATRAGQRNIAVRYSEAEPIEFALAHSGQVDWVWVDTNSRLPLDKESYKKLKDANFKLCLVCPERWGRPQDITKYKEYMKQNGIVIDAVMTALDYAEEWNA